MKAKLTIICVMSAICAVSAAQKPTAKKTSFSESELRALAKAVPDVKNAGQLYSVALATSNDVARQQAYLKASAAGLIACGKPDIYKRHVKGRLQNVAEFEAGLKDDCKQCSGNGTKDQRCLTCRGNGKCPSCKGTGQIMTTVSLSFDKQSKPCGKCNESGRCPKCDGEGSTMEKCFACAGTGKVFSKTVAALVFRDICNAIADGVDVVPPPNNADVNHRVNVNLEQQRTKQQNVVGEQLQRRSRRGRAEGGPARTMASSDHHIDNKLLGQLKDLEQHRYRLEDVVSAGNAILSTSKVPSEVISDTPFRYYGSDNDLEFKTEVRAIVKSAQTLLSDIEANQTEISEGEFKPDYYIEYWHKDTTDIRKRRLFDEVWEKALYSPHLQRDANNKPLGKVLHSKVPDNMVFVVSDVSLVELRGGVNVYCVELTALAFGEENYTLGRVWNGRKDQTERYVELAKKAGALESSTVRLLVPTSSHGDVEKWKKGDTVISKGWLNEWNVINAVRTYGNGEKEEYRKIEMSGEMFRSFRDWEKINTHVSL